MNTNIFDDFEEQSQEALEGLNFLNFEDFKKRNLGKDPFEGIRANKSFREISNEIALDSPFGNKSLFYKTSISNKSINQLTLGEFLVKKNIDISREQLFRLDANNTYIENVKSKYSNDLLCGDFKTNLTVHTYSGVNAARKRLETYSNNYTWFFEDDPKALNFFIYKSPFKDKVSSIVVDIGSDFFDCIKSVNISKEEAIKHLIKAFKLSFKKLKNKDLEYNLEELKKAIEDEFQAEEDYQILVGSLIEIYSSKPAVQTVLGLSKEWTEDVKKYRIDKKHYLPGEEGFDPLFFKVIRRESKKNETLPKELYEYVDDLLEANAYAVNAMVCGVINAVIDEAKNIAELPQFFYEIMTNRGSLKTFIRTVNEVLDNMLDFIIKIIKDLKKLHFGGSFYQFCYQYGYDAGFITIGVATAAIGKIIKFKKVAEFFSYFKKVANNKVFELAFRAGCIIEVDGKQLILTYNGTIVARGTVQKLTKKLDSLLAVKQKNPNIRYAYIGPINRRLKALIKLRKSHKSLYNANIATMTVRIIERGKPVRILKFKAQSSRKNKIDGSHNPKERYPNEADNFYDEIENKKRWSDSENKMIRDLEDNHLKGLNIEKVKIEVEINSIYHPCSKCQQVISNFQKYYNAKVKVFSTEAIGNTRFVELYPKLSTKNK